MALAVGVAVAVTVERTVAVDVVVSESGDFTLAAHGLEELFFQLCCCVIFFVSGGKSVLVLLTYTSRVQYSCGVVLVFGSGGK